MASEIRVNKITHTAGVGTITTNVDGIVVAGIVTANSFSGSGANLTDLSAAEVYGFTGIGSNLQIELRTRVLIILLVINMQHLNKLCLLHRA